MIFKGKLLKVLKWLNQGGGEGENVDYYCKIFILLFLRENQHLNQGQSFQISLH